MVEESRFFIVTHIYYERGEWIGKVYLLLPSEGNTIQPPYQHSNVAVFGERLNPHWGYDWTEFKLLNNLQEKFPKGWFRARRLEFRSTTREEVEEKIEEETWEEIQKLAEVIRIYWRNRDKEEIKVEAVTPLNEIEVNIEEI